MKEEPGTAEPDEDRPAVLPSHVVGVGASAGGLEALERLFETMPLDTGLAFVVVQHLSPDFKSLMDELLARKTAIPIHRAADGMEVRENAIYLIPPKKDMIISGGRLLLTDKDPRQLVTLPIDHFFRSLAHDLGDRSIGVILSGTGSDGSRGVRDIHEAGGLVIVQTPDTAKFDGMPNSARQTGAVNLALSPEEMPAALVRYRRDPLDWEAKLAPPDQSESEVGLDAVFRLLRDHHGIDFSHYKPSTIGRRIDRRLLLNRSVDLDDYVRRLRDDPAELNGLCLDLLIGVTRFFRDQEAFHRLGRDILPELLAQLGRDDDFRVWVAGCATGEEVYSLAILIHECVGRLGRPVNVKIFATDVHRGALEVASAGLYSEAQLADVDPERLAAYFVRNADGYQVTQELRQMVVFAAHNLIKDPPFTKIDLISCRNLLIYFQPNLQKKVISLFHFALKTSGVLFLGPSETPAELSDEFSTLDAHWKCYRKRRDIRLITDLRLPLSPSSTAGRPSGAGPGRASPHGLPDHQLLAAYDAMLERFMPPGLLVNEQGHLIQCFSGANRYLQLRTGRVSTDVLDMVDPEVKTVLGGALPRVIRDKKSVSYKGVRVQLPDGQRLVNIAIEPVVGRGTTPSHALVTLEDAGDAPALPSVNRDSDLGQASQDELIALEGELRYTKENLQATIEELETSNEELQATNEELVASNEELQSTNEELHSVNEELYTVNAEYQKKIAELTEMTADMDNLLHSTQVHTLFLDRKLCIRKFTPRIADTFHLLPRDIGRSIDGFAHGIDLPTLSDSIRGVMETGAPFEEQVRDRRGQWFLLRVLPYLSKEAIDGVVLTLIDLTRLKQAEAEARAKDQQLSGILRHSPHLVSIKGLDGRYLLVDQTFERVAGLSPVGRTAHEIFPRETADVLTYQDHRVIAEGVTVENEVVIPHADGPHTYLAVKFPMRDDAGRVVGVGGIKTDVTSLKAAEHEAREAVRQRDRFLAVLSHELRNPLGAIGNAAGVLERGGEEAERREATGVVRRQTVQMTRLLDDLLDVARVTQDKIQLRSAVVDLGRLAEEAARVARSAFDASGARLEVGDPGGPLLVLGDPARLQQLLVNLLTNGAKYTPAGGRVRLDVTGQGDEAVVRVADTGAGIRPEMLDKVFDLFVQADETLERSGGGLGVGLTLVRRIAELHGGRVSAVSLGPGTGSEFTVWLPMAGGGRPAPRPSGPPDRPPGRSRILVVEDNEDSRRMLEQLLRLDGHEVFVALDGREGLAAILRERPAVALIDISLPLMSGYEVAREARARLGPGEVYLVAVTGYGRPEDRRAVLAAGFDEHLIKPLNMEGLNGVLRRVGRPGEARPTPADR